jgi:hypothetical protein
MPAATDIPAPTWYELQWTEITKLYYTAYDHYRFGVENSTDYFFNFRRGWSVNLNVCLYHPVKMCDDGSS